MKLKFVLEEIDTKEKKAGETRVFKYRPTMKQYKSDVLFKISGKNSETIVENLVLPTGIGDFIIIETGAKEEQEKLK